jgi:hypothetical protein
MKSSNPTGGGLSFGGINFSPKAFLGKQVA